MGSKPFFVLLITVGVTLASSLALYVSHSKTKPAIPAYEESINASSNLARYVKNIDAIIYEILYDLGVPEKDILFLAVRPKHSSGLEWDFSEILVRLNEGRQLNAVQSSLLSSLKDVGPQVSFELEKASHDEAILHLFSGGYYTHKIRLTNRGYVGLKRKRLPKVALIVDDLGYDVDMLRAFSQLHLPMSFSVLPMAPYKGEVIRQAKAKRSQLILHLPRNQITTPK